MYSGLFCMRDSIQLQREIDGPCSVSQRIVRARGQKPGKIVESEFGFRFELQRLLIMIRGFAQQSFLNKRIRQRGICSGIIWLDRQRGLQLRDRAIVVPFLKEKDSQIVVRVRKIRPKLDRLAKTIGRLAQVALLCQHLAHIIMNQRETETIMTVFT